MTINDPSVRAVGAVESLPCDDPSGILVLEKLRNMWIALGEDQVTVPSEEVTETVEAIKEIMAAMLKARVERSN
ncbi:MAG: hypothetical protein C5B56_13020 [Proteobacteria bacterium]|nr:MAG: hypothetical protein C5B56_13020 [Pseudomonadota bacterium]